MLIPSDTINKCFEINKDANNGLDYQYDEVVRGKQHRHQLDAGDCDLCKEVCYQLNSQIRTYKPIYY